MSKEYRSQIKKALLSERGKLSENSLNTYVSLIANLSKRLEGIDSVGDLVKSKSKIMENIDGMKSVQSQKTLLSALYILTNDNDYKEKMMIHIKTTNDKYKEQKVSNKLKGSYITKEKIESVFESLADKVKKVPSIENYVNYLIVGLMSGLFIAPRRLEYAKVKIKNFDVKQDNYLDIKKKIIGFNQYKTHKSYGFQMIEIPKEILPTLKKYLKLNETDYLLIRNNGKQLSASDLSKRIGTIFKDDKIGVDVLRSIYISEIYKDVPELNKLEETAKQMSHSVSSAMMYYKKNDIGA